MVVFDALDPERQRHAVDVSVTASPGSSASRDGGSLIAPVSRAAQACCSRLVGDVLRIGGVERRRGRRPGHVLAVADRLAGLDPAGGIGAERIGEGEPHGARQVGVAGAGEAVAGVLSPSTTRSASVERRRAHVAAWRRTRSCRPISRASNWKASIRPASMSRGLAMASVAKPSTSVEELSRSVVSIGRRRRRRRRARR